MFKYVDTQKLDIPIRKSPPSYLTEALQNF